MKKGLIIIFAIILTLGIIGGNVSSALASILSGMLISSLGIFNLIIWYIIKNTAILHKAYLLKVTRLPSTKSYLSPTIIATIRYNFNDKEYVTEVSVGKNSPFANRNNIGKQFDIYMSEKFPKVVVDKIENNSTIYAISIIVFISGLFILMANI